MFGNRLSSWSDVSPNGQPPGVRPSVLGLVSGGMIPDRIGSEIRDWG